MSDEELRIIFVRDYAQTYIARCEGKTASCTAGRMMAAVAVARKVMAEKPFKLRSYGDSHYAWLLLEDRGGES